MPETRVLVVVEFRRRWSDDSLWEWSWDWRRLITSQLEDSQPSILGKLSVYGWSSCHLLLDSECLSGDGLYSFQSELLARVIALTSSFCCCCCFWFLLDFAWGVAEVKCILVTAVCVSICLSLTAFPHYCMDPDVTWENGRGCPLVVHYWVICSRCMGFVAMTT